MADWDCGVSTLGGIRTGLRRVPQVQTAVDGEPAEIMRDATARVSSLVAVLPPLISTP